MKAAAPHDAPAGPLSFLAFDFGTHRIGVATGNTLLRRGQPLATIAAQGAARWAAIERLVAEWRPHQLVLGIPAHPDGAEHENTRRARAFGRQLHGRFKLPVHEVDERYSTTEALADGAGGAGGARAAADADAAAAVIILEQFFRSWPAGPETHPDADAAT